MHRIGRVMDYIDAHFDRHLELKDVAEVAHFSPYHFHRVFTYLVGETPVDYIQRIRLEKAVRIIREEPWVSVTEVADLCGFGSVSLFCRTFKRYFGVTVTEFRQGRDLSVP